MSTSRVVATGTSGKIGIIAAMSALAGHAINIPRRMFESGKGLTNDAVDRIRARGGSIAYGFRTVEKHSSHNVLIDMANKPYRFDNFTGVITRMFEKSVPKHLRSRARHIGKQNRVKAVLAYFHAPVKDLRRNDLLGIKALRTNKGLAHYEDLVCAHKSIVEEARIQKEMAENSNLEITEVKPKRVRKPSLKSKEVIA